MGKLKNKWISGLIPALLIHICMGVIYCWSIIKTDVAYAMQCSTSDIEIAFSLSLLCLGLTTAIFGRFVDYDVKLSTGLAGLFFVLGMGGSVIAINCGSPTMFIVSYGVLQGIGLGIGYITPIKNLMMWFDEHKGVMIGLVLCMFGLSKILFAPAISNMVDVHGIDYAIGYVTVIGFVGMLIAKCLIDEPDGYGDDFKIVSLKDLWHDVCDKRFMSIWGMFFLNALCGVAMISYERVMLVDVCVNDVTFWVMVAAISNVLGRFFVPVIMLKQDHKATAFIYTFFVCAVATVLALISLKPWTMILMMVVVNFCYGGSFSALPILLHERYGYRNLALIHGLMLGAWAIGGFGGDMLADYLYRIVGDGGTVELIRKFFIFYMLAFIVTFRGFYANTK